MYETLECIKELLDSGVGVKDISAGNDSPINLVLKSGNSPSKLNTVILLIFLGSKRCIKEQSVVHFVIFE